MKPDPSQPTKTSLIKAVNSFQPGQDTVTVRLRIKSEETERAMNEFLERNKEYQTLKRKHSQASREYYRSYDRRGFKQRREYLIALINAHGVTPRTLKEVQEFVDRFKPESK